MHPTGLYWFHVFYTSLRWTQSRAFGLLCNSLPPPEALMPLRSNLAPRPRFFGCSMCHEFVELETPYVDEMGLPVHKECYLQKVSLKKSIRPPPEVSEASFTFLDSENARSIASSCPVCGSQLEHRRFTFFHEGRSWEIPFAICLDCETSDYPN